MFVTGYADKAASADGLAGHNMEVMVKPFGLDEFALKVSIMTSGRTDSVDEAAIA